MEIEQNLSEIKQQFDDVIKYTQNIPDPQTDRLFEIWRECKRDFIEVFNGKYKSLCGGKIIYGCGRRKKGEDVIKEYFRPAFEYECGGSDGTVYQRGCGAFYGRKRPGIVDCQESHGAAKRKISNFF